jgi:hypothetical protein
MEHLWLDDKCNEQGERNMQDKIEENQGRGAGIASTNDYPDSTQALPAPVHGILIGVLASIDEAGQPCVSYSGNLAVLPVPARATSAITADAIGKEVALLFENGDINKPIVVGVLQEPHASSAMTTTLTDEQIDPAASELIVDGRRIDLQAREQIVLRCGKSSITMTSAGKIIIRGTYVSSKSSGANRIKGGSVQIN